MNGACAAYSRETWRCSPSTSAAWSQTCCMVIMHTCFATGRGQVRPVSSAMVFLRLQVLRDMQIDV